MMSGACEDALYFDPRTAQEQALELGEAVGCEGDDPLACLRKLDAETISNALPMKRGLVLPPGVWWGPVIDGVELPARPMELIRRGELAKVPLMIGAARDEGILHTISFEQVTKEEVQAFVRDSFGESAIPAVVEKYERQTPKDSLTDIITDGIFVCQAREIARAVSAHQVPVYLYHFTRALEDPRVHGLGATHSVDIFFLYGNHDMGIGITDDETSLSRTMMDAWGRFAAKGDPSGGDLAWPRYSMDRDEHLELDMIPKPGAHLKSEICDFWDRRP
jgi:carboxylesterase type B